jgi:hypothetical protein
VSSDIDSLFGEYAERYMAADAEGVADLYEAPFLAVRSGAAIHLADRAAVVDHLAGLMAAYRNAGAAVADPVQIDVLAQGDSAVLATVRWEVRSASGDVIRDFRTSYQMIGPEPWRILAYVNHDLVRSDEARS